MTARQELSSWLTPSKVETRPVPDVNSKAPSVPQIQFPRDDGKPVLVAFLRHCGCPFAEKTFLSLRQIASDNRDVRCIAVSHSEKEHTDKWLESVGGAGGVEVIIDDQRHIYAAYGLSVSSFWHVLNPWSMSAVFKLGRGDNIWNRPTESGSRWQTAGVYGVDASGTVRYSHPSQATDDLGNFDEALESFKNAAKL